MPTYRCWIADEIMADRHPELRRDQTEIKADSQEDAALEALARFAEIEKAELQDQEQLQVEHIQCEVTKD